MHGLAEKVIPPKRARVGRHRINAEKGDRTLARFAEGTLDRIKAALEPKETLAAFIRTAVEAELKRRGG